MCLLKIQLNVVLDVMEQYFKLKKWWKRESVITKDVLLVSIVIGLKLTNYKYLWASIHNCIARLVTQKFGIHLCLWILQEIRSKLNLEMKLGVQDVVVKSLRLRKFLLNLDGSTNLVSLATSATISWIVPPL